MYITSGFHRRTMECFLCCRVHPPPNLKPIIWKMHWTPDKVEPTSHHHHTPATSRTAIHDYRQPPKAISTTAAETWHPWPNLLGRELCQLEKQRWYRMCTPPNSLYIHPSSYIHPWSYTYTCILIHAFVKWRNPEKRRGEWRMPCLRWHCNMTWIVVSISSSISPPTCPMQSGKEVPRSEALVLFGVDKGNSGW